MRLLADYGPNNPNAHLMPMPNAPTLHSNALAPTSWTYPKLSTTLYFTPSTAIMLRHPVLYRV